LDFELSVVVVDTLYHVYTVGGMQRSIVWECVEGGRRERDFVVIVVGLGGICVRKKQPVQ
jgi:hypothetical protein